LHKFGRALNVLPNDQKIVVRLAMYFFNLRIGERLNEEPDGYFILVVEAAACNDASMVSWAPVVN
jgi:hypothetical protein